MSAEPLSPPTTDPTPIFEHFRGSYGTELLTAAVVEFDLFRRLTERPKSFDELRAEIGLQRRPAVVLFTTLRAMRLLAVDAGGLLSVGPESAGSRPGPVAYGQGNTRPTLTDANIVLGRINAEKPIGGKLARLDVEAARAAILEHIAAPLSLSAEAGAEAIVRIANAKMAGAIRLVSVERGHDPTRFTAVPFGGGGALHVGALIREVGLKAALVPRYPGITSALGCIIADVRHDQVATVNLMLHGLDTVALDARMVAAGEEAHVVVAASGLTIERIEVTYELDMHYQGQTHTVAVPLPVTLAGKTTGLTGRNDFARTSRKYFRYSYPRNLSAD